jgi:hypothetical protein
MRTDVIRRVSCGRTPEAMPGGAPGVQRAEVLDDLLGRLGRAPEVDRRVAERVGDGSEEHDRESGKRDGDEAATLPPGRPPAQAHAERVLQSADAAVRGRGGVEQPRSRSHVRPRFGLRFDGWSQRVEEFLDRR